VTWGIDQVNQERVTVSLLLDVLDILVVQAGVQGDGGGLNGNTSLLLILSGVHKSGVTSLGGRDDTGSLDQRVGQSGFTVIDVGNDGDVTHIGNLVHQATDLVNSESN